MFSFCRCVCAHVCIREQERIYESLSELFDILTPETGGYENLQYYVN